MEFLDLLVKNRDKIADTLKERELMIRVGNQVIKTSNNGQFTNPVSFTIGNSLDSILDSLLENKEIDDQVLDDIIRIRAVQTMPPSKAISFTYKLKEIIRDLVKDKSHYADLLKFENKLDELISRSLDIYMGCREQIFKIKLQELEKGVFADVESGAGCPVSLLDSIENDQKTKKISLEKSNEGRSPFNSSLGGSQ